MRALQISRCKVKRPIAAGCMGRSLNGQGTRLLTGGMRVRIPCVPQYDSRSVA
jgi:hypothetical protein